MSQVSTDSRIMKLTGGSLCTGYGGLDLAVAWLFHDLGVDLRFVWDSDIKPAAQTLLAHRRPHAPNLGDIHDIATPLVDTPPVDVLTFGWPCQPHSAAGKRLGEADPRAIWPEVARIIARLRPTYLFGENVARVASNGELRRVVQALAEIGYVGSWRCVRAGDPAVGAPHRRDRLFLVGVRADVAADALGLLLRDEPRRSGGPDRSGPGVAGDDGPERSTGGLTLLPTPGARDHKGVMPRGERKDGYARSDAQLCLPGAVALLPSPTARLGASGSVTPAAAAARAARRPNGPNLDDAIALLPTPTASSDKRGMCTPEEAQRRRNAGRRMLEDAIALLPTPRASDGPNGGPSQRGRRGDLAMSSAAVLMDGRDWGRYAAAIHHWEQVTGCPAPEATAPLGKGGAMRLAPAFVEWMMGLPAGWVTGVPGLTRAQQLSMLGDGVVPQQARYAYGLLLTDLAATTEAVA